MNIHEYQGKELFKKFGVAVPRGVFCQSVEEAVRAAETLGGKTGRLTMVFAGLIFIVALYMLWRSAAAFLPGMTI